jgi:hypothetical protein
LNNIIPYNKQQQRGNEEAPEKGNESSHSAHANGMNENNKRLKDMGHFGSFVYGGSNVHSFT